MNSMTIQLPEELWGLIYAESERQGKPVSQIVQEHLSEKFLVPLPTEPHTAKQRSEEVLRKAGLLAEMSDEERHYATHCSASLADVRAALDRSRGPTLSSIVLEQRGPKV